MGKIIDLTGKVFGRLTVVCSSEVENQRGPRWICRCECGKNHVAASSNLQVGNVRSCGCLSRDRSTKHGMFGTPTYKSWTMMIQRCRNPNDVSYANYGGRGIKVCDRWADFRNFFADMGLRPDGCSLDRISSDGDYERTNCQWSTPAAQARNRRSTRLIRHGGKVITIAEYIELTGVSDFVARRRLKNGELDEVVR